MGRRERKILGAAMRASYEALAAIEPAASGDVPATPAALARALRAILEGQIAILEALGAGASIGPEESRDRPGPRPESGPAARATGAGLRAERAGDAAEVGAAPPAAAPEAAPLGPETSGAEGPPRPVAPDAARAAMEAFPLDNMNRWLASGTVFQIRGSLAFLNVNSMGGGKVEEMRGHIRNMGFSEELGRLEGEGIDGAILLLRRPEN